MFWIKACPRCKGDVLVAHDQYGQYASCAQCGHYLTAAQEAVLYAQRLPAGADQVSSEAGSSPRDMAKR